MAIPAPISLQIPQVQRILPGPAGKLQQLAAAGALNQATPEALGLREHHSSSANRATLCLHDVAFTGTAWRNARAYAEQEQAKTGDTEGLNTIQNAKELKLGKLPRLLVMLGSVQPSGAGSAFARCKDLTGHIGAAVHSTALQKLQQLGPGCVLLLRQVSVFTPTPGTSYMAVTAQNIVKVWPADPMGSSVPYRQGPLHQQWRQQQHQAALTSISQQHSSSQQDYNTAGLQQQRQQQQLQHQLQGSRQGPSLGLSGSNRTSMLPPPSPDIHTVLKMPNRQTPSLQAGLQHGSQHCQQPSLQPQGQGQPGSTSPPADEDRYGNIASVQAAAAAESRGRAGTMLPPPPKWPQSTQQQQLPQQQQQQQSLRQQVLGRRQQQCDELLKGMLGDVDLDDAVGAMKSAAGSNRAMSCDNGPAGVVSGRVNAGAGGGSRDRQRVAASRQSVPRQQQHPHALVTGTATPGPGRSMQLPQQTGSQLQGSNMFQGLSQHLQGSSSASQQRHGPNAASGAGGDGGEPPDGVDNVVAAIFGSQLGLTLGNSRQSMQRPAAAVPCQQQHGGQQLTSSVALKPVHAGNNQALSGVPSAKRLKPSAGNITGVLPPAQVAAAVASTMLQSPSCFSQQQQQQERPSSNPLQQPTGHAVLPVEGGRLPAAAGVYSNKVAVMQLAGSAMLTSAQGEARAAISLLDDLVGAEMEELDQL